MERFISVKNVGGRERVGAHGSEELWLLVGREGGTEKSNVVGAFSISTSSAESFEAMAVSGCWIYAFRLHTRAGRVYKIEKI